MSSLTVSGDLVWRECAALLREDFASFAAWCFRELNPRALFAMNSHFELIAAKLARGARGPHKAADRQRAAAPLEVAVTLQSCPGKLLRRQREKNRRPDFVLAGLDLARPGHPRLASFETKTWIRGLSPRETILNSFQIA